MFPSYLIMSERNNHYIELLHNNPSRLVEEMQPFIRKTVFYFLLRIQARPDLHDEIVQTINEKLLSQKLTVIQRQYNQSVKFLTYFTKIISNMCKEYMRSRSVRQKYFADLEESNISLLSREKDFLENVVIQEEVQRLDYYLRMYFKDYSRLVIGLKFYIRYPVTVGELEKKQSCATNAGDVGLGYFLENQYAEATDKEIYSRLVRIFKTNGKKETSPDSVRKWIQCRMDKIIELLNQGNFEGVSTNYTRETFKILLLKYFEMKQKQN